MIVRGIDGNNDWLFGKGLNDYKSANAAVTQNIKTRLQSFLGDCFFDQGAGIDWLGFIGGKNALGLNLAISAVILNTANVLGIVQLYINLNAQRQFSIAYEVQTSYSKATGTVELSI